MVAAHVRDWRQVSRVGADREIVARCFALMWAVGGVLLVAELVLFDRVAASGWAVWSLALSAAAIGIVSWHHRDRLSLPAMRVGAFMGVAAVTAAVLLMGRENLVSGLALMYVWVAVFASLFLQPPMAWALIATTVLGYAAIVMRFQALPGTSPLVLATTLCIVGVAIEGLHRARAASETDPTTGALNTVGLTRLLEHSTPTGPRAVAVVRVAAGGEGSSAMLDQSGHRPNSPQLVAEWARQLAQDEVVARLSTDTYAVVLSVPTVEVAARRLRALRTWAPASSYWAAGLALQRPGEGPAGLLARAEAALDAARQHETDRIVVHPLDDSFAEELHGAIERREFVLEWQPTINVTSGRLAGFETLLRWEHPTRGRLAPDEFIPLAERTGLIVPLGRWVLDQACAQAARWDQTFGLDDLTIAVNVSGRQLDEETFVEEVVATLDRRHLPASRIVLELTESVLPGNLEKWRHRLQRLRTTGVHLAIDDFGTGYSSLSHLRDLPFSTIKVDRSFITDLGRDPEADALLSAVMGMASGLSKQVITEGVETPRQLAAVRDHGCDRAQGFLLGRPMHAHAAEGIVAQHTQAAGTRRARHAPTGIRAT